MSEAVRSNDLGLERWDLLSGAACRQLYLFSNMQTYEIDSQHLVAMAVEDLQSFLGHNGHEVRLQTLTRGWWHLSVAIQKLDMPPSELDALRSLGNHYPYYALKRLARTCYEGATTYAEENWHNGFELKSLANHALQHMTSWSNGRTPLSKFWEGQVEDELGHAHWGFMAMTHTWLFRQDKCNLLLGRNYTITEELQKYHDEHASRRKPKSEPSDKYWEDILQKEEETKKRIELKDEARGGPSPVPLRSYG